MTPILTQMGHLQVRYRTDAGAIGPLPLRRPPFQARNDAEWLRTTKAAFSVEAPVFSNEGVDISLIKPRVRDYRRAKGAESGQENGEEMKPAGVDRYAEDERSKVEQKTAGSTR